MATNKKIIVIVGPTGSGKTEIAIKCAKKHNGEIICADSRTIYNGMNVGTAKPSMQEQQKVVHWGLNLVQPGERFTVADFKAYAQKTIQDIQSRGKTAILVGGTGLYVDSVLFDYQFEGAYDKKMRNKLQILPLDALYVYCREHNIKLPENERNKRYVIRAIERNNNLNTSNHRINDDFIVVGITTDKITLSTRLKRRSEQIFEDGVVNEAKTLGNTYGWNSEAMTGNIYPIVYEYLQGLITLNEAQEKFVRSDQQLAKRQMTWLRRNPYILWSRRTEALDFITQRLARE